MVQTNARANTSLRVVVMGMS
eukprot:COSAG01_NODE_60706_length_293_cov_0.814433_1_plen_20_part_01